jgi:DNA replication protein DnaC
MSAARIQIGSELVTALKRLRLGGLLPTLTDRLALADKQSLPYQDVLLMLLTDEISRRDSTAADRRATEAGLDQDMVFERWDKSAKVTYDKRVLAELSSLRFVEEHRNVVILGPVGVGKTFLAMGLGHLCCRAGFNVRFLRADTLLRTLKQSRMDNSRDAVMAQLASVDVLIIDDFALEPMSREESRDIYQLFVERNARCSSVVTSNRDTAEWIAAFDDALLAQSAVDRFKNNAFDLVVDGESYRSRLKPNIDKMGPPPTAPVRKPPHHPRRRRPAVSP